MFSSFLLADFSIALQNDEVELRIRAADGSWAGTGAVDAKDTGANDLGTKASRGKFGDVASAD